MDANKPVVAIAGATGFVGQALRLNLVADHTVIGLTRSPTRASLPDEDGVLWRHCDLFSVRELTEALEGVDYAIYLVHSMLPSARLVQANFEDLDLLLADNFARAAEAQGIKQIVYLGGIQPRDTDVSRHLTSRLEVERTLAGRASPMTALRAGLVVGAGGSSMSMLVNLVRRLPVMLLPKWAESRSAPIAIVDVVRAVRRCLGRQETFGKSYEIGGPEQLSYREMLLTTAKALHRKPPLIGLPVFSPSLSRQWISMVSGAPDALVGPLIESLHHELIPAPNELQDWLCQDAKPFSQALAESIDSEGKPLPNPRRQIRSSDQNVLHQARTVRSVQRLPLPPKVGAEWVAQEYMRWLPKFVWPFLACRVDDGDKVRFYLRMTGICLLELSYAPERSEPDRQVFRITGGVLARPRNERWRGRFEFREVLSGQAIIAAIHDFRPRLPWLVYNWTQALVHLWVMRGFGRHLARVTRRMLPPQEETKALEGGIPQLAHGDEPDGAPKQLGPGHAAGEAQASSTEARSIESSRGNSAAR